ncbi:dienelactone hydrolase [Nocardia pseudobrasiliensis]|uniref:Dienelactone hydrolase n=2 Tax=Nocardia pseudobrasiliensis TaxID=45979 RepID=A0A370HPG0_9NOCA|nr:dienelactone hydrolase [Nocardia pseudobrasiliensis]
MTTAEIASSWLQHDDEVVVPVEHVELAGHLRVPMRPTGVVVFAHGSGTDRNSPRNKYLAGLLAGQQLATLTIDLLMPAETIDRAPIFDVGRLGRRLTAGHSWLQRSPIFQELPVGYFGAGSDAPVALWAAAESRDTVRAVVVRGGRPDLAGERLHEVLAPTLFLVGGHDQRVRAANHRAAERMRCEHRVTELTAPGHVWGEPRLTRWAAYLAAVWFTKHLTENALMSETSRIESGPARTS